MDKSDRQSVAIIGSRGVPASYGGFETFAEEIAVHLYRNHGYRVTVVCDAVQREKNNGIEEFEGVSLRYSEYEKGKNPIRFYRDSIKKVINDHDVICSCGPAGGLFGPLVRRYGKILLTNTDGLNSKRAKWGWAVRKAFRLFEWTSCRFSDRVICDASEIEKYVRKTYGCYHTDVAEYGAYPNPWLGNSSESIEILKEFGLEAGAYHLVVSRLEPENNVESIIRGYTFSEHKIPLIVVGNLKKTLFVRELQNISNDNVRFIGGIYDRKKLAIVRANAASYLHGHSVGGTNPSLLEAMASRNICICHNNPFNREVVGENGIYFDSAEDVDTCLTRVENSPQAFPLMRDGAFDRIENYYNWHNIALKYHRIIQASLLKESK